MTSLFMCVAAERTLRTAYLTLELIPFVYIIDYRISYSEVAVSLNYQAMNLKVVKRERFRFLRRCNIDRGIGVN